MDHVDRIFGISVEARHSLREHPIFVGLVVSFALAVLFIGFALGQVFENGRFSRFLEKELLSRASPRFAPRLHHNDN